MTEIQMRYYAHVMNPMTVKERVDFCYRVFNEHYAVLHALFKTNKIPFNERCKKNWTN